MHAFIHSFAIDLAKWIINSVCIMHMSSYDCETEQNTYWRYWEYLISMASSFLGWYEENYLFRESNYYPYSRERQVILYMPRLLDHLSINGLRLINNSFNCGRRQTNNVSASIPSDNRRKRRTARFIPKKNMSRLIFLSSSLEKMIEQRLCRFFSDLPEEKQF